jgi:hypothetical protein
MPDWVWRRRFSGFDAVFHPIAAAFDDHGFGVVEESVENGGGEQEIKGQRIAPAAGNVPITHQTLINPSKLPRHMPEPLGTENGFALHRPRKKAPRAQCPRCPNHELRPSGHCGRCPLVTQNPSSWR